MNHKVIEFSMVTFWDWLFQIINLGIILIPLVVFVILAILGIKFFKRAIKALDLYIEEKEQMRK